MRVMHASSSALALLFILSPAVRTLAQPGQGDSPGTGKGQASSGANVERQPQAPQQGQVPVGIPFPNVDYTISGNPNAGNMSWITTVQNMNFAWIDDASRNSGMTLAPADPALQAHLGLAKGAGLIVTAIDPGCPAAAAGIQQNDVLVRLDGDGGQTLTLLDKPGALEYGLRSAGERAVSLVLRRAGKEMTLKVQPRLRASLGPVPAQAPESLGYWIGVQAATVEPALRAQLQLPHDQGLIIAEVFNNSPAARAGVQVHDVFLKMDDVPMTDTSALTKHVQSRADKPVKIELLRAGRKLELQVTPEPRKMSSWVVNALPKIAQFDVVLPGAVLSGQDARAREIEDITRQIEGLFREQDARTTSKPVGANPPTAGAPRTAGSGKSIEQRLDDLSGQIKELRAAVEALARPSEKK